MFYILSTLHEPSPSRDRLAAVCLRRGVRYTLVDPLTFDPTSVDLSAKDSFYRIADSLRARQLDIYFTKMQCRSVKIIDSHLDFTMLDTMERDRLCLKAGIACIPTIYFPILDPTLLIAQVESLGGFPIIIKEMGSLGGKGIMKVDSISSLLSILRNVIAAASGDIVLKKYIEHDEQARIIVLNGQVIGEKANIKNGHDVVLNAGTHFAQERRTYSADIHTMAIAAAKAVKLSFAGVDILIGLDGKNYLAEVNMRPAFSYVEEIADVDIAGKIVDFLN
jgi:biotin carboxylase